MKRFQIFPDFESIEESYKMDTYGFNRFRMSSRIPQAIHRVILLTFFRLTVPVRFNVYSFLEEHCKLLRKGGKDRWILL
jgi:hypothetical protein